MNAHFSKRVAAATVDLDYLDRVARSASREAATRERIGAKTLGALARREGLIAACQGRPEMLLWAVRQMHAQIRALTPKDEQLIQDDLADEIAHLLREPPRKTPPVRHRLAAFGTEPAQATRAALDALGFVRLSAPEQAPHFVGRTDMHSLKLFVIGEACEISPYHPPAHAPATPLRAATGADEREALPTGSSRFDMAQAEPAKPALTAVEMPKASTDEPEEQTMPEGAGGEPGQPPLLEDSAPSELQASADQSAGPLTAGDEQQASTHSPRGCPHGCPISVSFDREEQCSRREAARLG